MRCGVAAPVKKDSGQARVRDVLLAERKAEDGLTLDLEHSKSEPERVEEERIRPRRRRTVAQVVLGLDDLSCSPAVLSKQYESALDLASRCRCLRAYAVLVSERFGCATLAVDTAKAQPVVRVRQRGEAVRRVPQGVGRNSEVVNDDVLGFVVVLLEDLLADVVVKLAGLRARLILAFERACDRLTIQRRPHTEVG